MNDITWMTKEQAAEYLGIGMWTVDEYCRKGKLQRYRPGGTGHPRFKRIELDRLMVKAHDRRAA